MAEHVNPTVVFVFLLNAHFLKVLRKIKYNMS